MNRELVVVCLLVVVVNFVFSLAERKIFHKEPED